ncbi:hypothetical protein PR048_012183 [Dryococelus australis]|uniref:DUF7869 domain-containing protein n=1 Tax=Dryococelus australis TaxID=614101 RepID=A0ABQ9HNQ5_9NEOP|nr:hypothetical protein PR048_012183 [Dryococelus australis]
MHEILLNTYQFGFPRSDICSIFDTLAININNMECSTEETRAGNIVCLSFDYMQNLPLSHLKTNAIFYSCQLWHNVFGVHDLGSDNVTVFTYHEGDGTKGSNEVTSMLLTYINNNNEPLDNLVLILISDSCCGQNKNQTMVHFLFALVHCFHVFKTVMYLFLVRGHSYLPNDQAFSIIDKK